MDIQKKCLDCFIKISKRAKRCNTCSKKGIPLSKEHIEKIRLKNKGKKRSEKIIRERIYKSNWNTFFKIDKNGCHIFQLHIHPNGYGSKFFEGKVQRAHRVFFKRSGRTLSEKDILDHLCRNRACVNPEHLEIVSQEVNSQRGSQAKLNPDKVIAMRKMHSDGLNYSEIARRMNITHSTARDVILRISWKNIK